MYFGRMAGMRAREGFWNYFCENIALIVLIRWRYLIL
jgi:hypothetical protein